MITVQLFLILDFRKLKRFAKFIIALFLNIFFNLMIISILRVLFSYFIPGGIEKYTPEETYLITKRFLRKIPKTLE